MYTRTMVDVNRISLIEHWLTGSMSVTAILQQSSFYEGPFVDNCTVSKHRIKNHADGLQAHPSWRGLRLANMPLLLWIVLLAAVIGGFLVILFHK
jgi:hypothetical protein